MTSISIKQSLKFPDFMENVELLEQMNLKGTRSFSYLSIDPLARETDENGANLNRTALKMFMSPDELACEGWRQVDKGEGERSRQRFRVYNSCTASSADTQLTLARLRPREHRPVRRVQDRG